MGIWLELGIFLVILAWGLWQWHDARQALARTRAQKARAREQSQEQPGKLEGRGAGAEGS